MGGTENKVTKRHAKRNFRSHATGLRRTLKARHPKVGMSAEARAFFESAIHNSVGGLTRASARCMRSAGRETVAASDVALAWKLSVPEAVRAKIAPSS